jgi:NhaP-type Na+/H+ and K+/H+ antiporter
VTLVVRDDQPQHARGSHVFEPGDEVVVLSDDADATALHRLFEVAAD